MGKVIKFLFVLFVLLVAVPSSATVYFSESFDTDQFTGCGDNWSCGSGSDCYGFDGCKFGYSDNSCCDPQPDWDGSDACDSGSSGSHKIVLDGLTGTQTNYDIHFEENLSSYNLTAYYQRFCLYFPSDFPWNPGANWKLSYNYGADLNTNGFVLWMRPTTEDGFQPAIYSTPGGDQFKTEACDTFFVKNFLGNWVCLELWVDWSANDAKLWITTDDGTYDETLYIDVDNWDPQGTKIYNWKLGAYWDGSEQAGKYFLLDEAVISDSYIGPPAGFGNGGDVTPPTLSSATIASNGTTLTLAFDETVSQGTGYNDSDWDLDISGGDANVSITYSSGNGTSSHVYTISQTIYSGATVDIDFNGDANSMEDGAGNDLAAITSGAVVNNSTQAVPAATVQGLSISGCSIN